MGNVLSSLVHPVNNCAQRNTPPCLFLLVFLLCCFFSNNSFAQSISIKRASIPVGNLLAEITQQSGYNFSYAPQLIDSKRRIPFKVRKATLEKNA